MFAKRERFFQLCASGFEVVFGVGIDVCDCVAAMYLGSDLVFQDNSDCQVDWITFLGATGAHEFACLGNFAAIKVFHPFGAGARHFEFILPLAVGINL